MVLKPSKLVIDLPGNVGSSKTINKDHPAECPVPLNGLRFAVSPGALETFPTV